MSSERTGGARGKSPEAEERRIFIVAALALAVFPALLFFRRFDDNTLTSWRWVFRFCDATPVFVFHILAIAAAYFLSYLSFRGRRPAVVLFAWTDLPLVPFIYGTVFRFLGEARHWIQAVTSLMFAMTVVLTFLIGKRLWDEEVGFLGGAFLLGIPYLLTQVPLMLVDVPTMFFSTLSLFLLIIALEQGGAARLSLSSVAVVLALEAKYSTWVLHGSTLAVVVFVFLMRDGPRPVLRRAAVVGATSAALFGTLVLLQYGSMAPQLELLQAYQWPGLKRWGESFASTLLFQTHPFLSLLAACSVYVAVKKKDVTYLIVVWMWVMIVLLQVRRIRYVIPAMPMLALMGAYGLRILPGGRLRRFAVFCAVGGSLAVALAAYRPFLGNMSIANLQAAGAFLDASDGIRAARVTTAYREGVVINPAVTIPLLDLFTSRRIVTSPDEERVPAPRNVGTSSYRFTWEYQLPEYYLSRDVYAPAETAMVVISEKAGGALPAWANEEDYQPPEIFARSAVFRFKTHVSVYLPLRNESRGAPEGDGVPAHP